MDVRLELIDADDRARGRMGTAVIVVATTAALAASFGTGAPTEYDGTLSIAAFAGVLVALAWRSTSPSRAEPTRLARPGRAC